MTRAIFPLLLCIFCNCDNSPKVILVKKLPSIPKRDTAIDEGKPIILNEYYTYEVENNLYDTLYFGMAKIGTTSPLAVHASLIEHYTRDGVSKGASYINTGHALKIEKISKGTRKKILFCLPEFSDSMVIHRFKLDFGYDSLNVMKYRNFFISSGDSSDILIIL